MKQSFKKYRGLRKKIKNNKNFTVTLSHTVREKERDLRTFINGTGFTRQMREKAQIDERGIDVIERK